MCVYMITIADPVAWSHIRLSLLQVIETIERKHMKVTLAVTKGVLYCWNLTQV